MSNLWQLSNSSESWEHWLIQRRLPMIIECSSRIREWSVKMLISFYLHFLTTNLMLMKHPWVIKKRPVIKAHNVKGGSNSKGRRRRQSYVTCPLQKTSNQGWQGPFMVVKEAPREITFNGGPPKYQVVLKALTSSTSEKTEETIILSVNKTVEEISTNVECCFGYCHHYHQIVKN